MSKFLCIVLYILTLSFSESVLLIELDVALPLKARRKPVVTDRRIKSNPISEKTYQHLQIQPILCQCYHLINTLLKIYENRSSFSQMFYKTCVSKNFEKFTGNHLCRCLFLNEVAGLTPATLLKNILRNRCFLVNFVKFLEKPSFIEHFQWLLLKNNGNMGTKLANGKLLLVICCFEKR